MNREIFLLVALLAPARLDAEPGALFPEALAVAVVLPAPYDPGLAQLYSMIPPNAMEPPRLTGLPSAPSSEAGRLPLMESSVIALSGRPRPAPPTPAPVVPPVVTSRPPAPAPSRPPTVVPAPVPVPPPSQPDYRAYYPATYPK